MKKLSLLLVLVVCSVFGADITGTWKGTAEGPAGPIERTFIFKVDGNKLTGETSSTMAGKSTIDDGKIDGDDISFNIKANVQGNDVKATFKGKIAGGEIKLHMDSDAGFSTDYVVKKVS